MASFACCAACAIRYLYALAEDGRAYCMLGQLSLQCQHVHKPSEQSLARLLQKLRQRIVAKRVGLNIVTRKVSKCGCKLFECHRNSLVLSHSLEANSQSAIQIPYSLRNS